MIVCAESENEYAIVTQVPEEQDKMDFIDG